MHEETRGNQFSPKTSSRHSYREIDIDLIIQLTAINLNSANRHARVFIDQHLPFSFSLLLNIILNVAISKLLKLLFSL